MVICGLGPCKGGFATASHGLVQCREQCYEERERRVAVKKSGASFGTQSRYRRQKERERESCCEDRWYWICGVFHI